MVAAMLRSSLPMPGWAMTLVNPVSITLDSHMGSLLGQVVVPAASRAEMLSTAWHLTDLGG